MTPRGPELYQVELLLSTTRHVARLCEDIILGGNAEIANAMRVLPSALYVLQERAQAIIDALAREP